MLVLTGIVVSSAWLIQPAGWAAGSHYALVQSLADGTPHIDRYHEDTGDKTWWDGHYHSNKAPGLAALSLPAYVILERVPPIARDRDRMIWSLNLWAVALATIGLFLTARYVGDRLTDGLGTIGATALVLGSMVLPFSTMYFSHVTAAALGLGGFALLLRERSRAPSLAALFAAGLLTGLAVVFEYPMGLVVLWLFAYAVLRPGRARRALAFGIGSVVGVIPLLVYNVWQFGSAFHLSYTAQIVTAGTSGHDVLSNNGDGFFGVALPSLTGLVQILGVDRGLLVLTPVAAAGAVSLVLLYRVGRRAEAITCGGIAASTLLYNAGYDPSFGGVFGGDTPGPRFLLTALPFLFVPLGLVYRRAPIAVAALLVISALTMSVGAATDPRIVSGQTGLWLTRIRERNFVDTVATEVGAPDGWFSIAPYFVAIALALTVALFVTPARRLDTRDLAAAVGVVGAWALAAGIVPRVLGASEPDLQAVALAALVLGSTTAFGVVVGASVRDGPARSPGTSASGRASDQA